MSEKGLEPSRSYPHEPESCASTNFATPTCTIILFNCQINFIYVANVVSSTTLSKNPQRFGFSCGRVPLRLVRLYYLIVKLILSTWRMLCQAQPSRKILNGSDFSVAECHFDLYRNYTIKILQRLAFYTSFLGVVYKILFAN